MWSACHSALASVGREDPGGDVVQHPVHAGQQVVTGDCAAAHNAPVVGLDVLQTQRLHGGSTPRNGLYTLNLETDTFGVVRITFHCCVRGQVALQLHLYLLALRGL